MRLALAMIALLAATPAMAQDRDYCPERPGLGNEPCTIDAGRVSVEIGVASWQHDSDSAQRSDSVVLGDTLVRVGLDSSTDLGVEWTGYVHVRTRDRAMGVVTSDQGAGDLVIALKHNLVHPDGSGFSIAVSPIVSLPTGSGPGTAGVWSAGLLVPVSYDLGHGFGLAGTSQVSATANSDGHGRHFLASQIIGLNCQLSGTVSLTLEGQVLRDEDPAGATTQAFAAASLAWSPHKHWQLDFGAVAGLNANSPDLQLYGGISRLF